MSTIISLIRHGETEWNTAGKFQGCQDISLSMEGIVQAQLLKKRFNNQFDFVYTSPLNRAFRTAEIICEDKNIEPIIDNELREINFGIWEGLTIREIEHNYPMQFHRWRNDEINGPLMDGELSIKAAGERMKKAVLKIARECKDKNVIIVSHGGIIKAGLLSIFEWKMNMYHKMVLGNTSVCKLSFDSSLIPTIITLNDTSHLPINNNLIS